MRHMRIILIVVSGWKDAKGGNILLWWIVKNESKTLYCSIVNITKKKIQAGGEEKQEFYYKH